MQVTELRRVEIFLVGGVVGIIVSVTAKEARIVRILEVVGVLENSSSFLADFSGVLWRFSWCTERRFFARGDSVASYFGFGTFCRWEILKWMLMSFVVVGVLDTIE